MTTELNYDICCYIGWFVVFSFAGWVYECIYCTFMSGAWDNRGFLFGPVCPIYGVSTIVAVIVFEQPVFADGLVPWWGIFLISMAGASLIEFATSLLLEGLFGARWWDYSNAPLNLQGRICLPASIAFGIMGLVVYYLVMPLVAFSAILPSIAWEIFALICVAVIAADAALTVDALTDLVVRLKEIQEEFDGRMDKYLDSVNEQAEVLGSKVREMTPDPTHIGVYATKAKEPVEQTVAKMRHMAAKLSARQRYALKSISVYSSQTANTAAAKVRAMLDIRNSKRGDNIARVGKNAACIVDDSNNTAAEIAAERPPEDEGKGKATS